MSNLLIRGKKYICENCSKTYTLEYEGGAQMTQISDMGVINQNHYNLEFNNERYNADIDGYYYYFFPHYCETCIPDLGYDDVNNHILDKNNPVAPYFNLIYEFEEIFDELISDEIDKVVTNLKVSDLKTINPESYSKHILSKFFKLTYKRKELVEKCFDENKDKIEKYILEKVIDSEGFKEVSNQYFAEALYFEKLILKLISKGEGIIYHFEIDSTDPDELNPYISYERTVRVVDKTEPQYMFYSEGFVLPLKSMMESLTDDNFTELLDEIFSEQYINYNKIKEKLVQEAYEISL